MDAIAALEAECHELSAVLLSLDESDYERVTNCLPWNLKELTAHILGSVFVDVTKLPDAAPGAPVVEAADYYRRDERSDESYRRANVERWRDIAVRFASGREVAETFRDVWPKTVAATRNEDPGRLVGLDWGPAITLADYVVTRVIAVAAHGVDVAITLERDRWTTPAALDAIKPALLSLIGEEPPASLQWTDQDLLEAGTGRRPLSKTEIAELGEAAERFPLLS